MSRSGRRRGTPLGGELPARVWGRMAAWTAHYFDCTGRIHRASYLLRLATGTLLAAALSWVSLVAAGQLGPQRHLPGVQLALLQLVLIDLVYLWFFFSTLLKRLHDVDLGAELKRVLLVLLPIAVVYLAVARGSFSQNEHGPVPGD